jgi:cytoskeletal protein RodZ
MSLEALERSDLARLPGGIFTRAFIRAYAQEVGLDPDRTIQDFVAEQPPEATTTTARSSALQDGEKLDSDTQAVTTALRLALVSVPIIALVVYFGTQQPASDISGAAPEIVETASAAPVRLTMEIALKATCWVSATVDGEPTFSRLMNAGDKQVIHAKEQILVNVGDAGAFAYTLNGRQGRPLGAPGEVVSKRFTLSSVNEFAAP